jgi:hypothetical protein
MTAKHYGFITRFNFTRTSVRSKASNISIATIALLLVLAGTAFGQNANSEEKSGDTAHIPYDFWIADARLPAGDYTISRVISTIVLFRNVQTKAEAQAFLLPTETHSVAADDQKLVFILRDGQHYLREVWNSDGRQVISSESGIPLPAQTSVTAVPLMDQRNAEVTPGQ